MTTVIIGYFDHSWSKSSTLCTADCLAGHKHIYRVTVYKKMDTSAFSADLQRSNSMLFLPDDPDEVVLQLDGDLVSGLDRFAPLKTHTSSHDNHESN